MASTATQRSFSAGEIAPALWARVDTVKYGSGLRAMRNNFVMRHGGGLSRPGTQFICEVKDSARTVRLVPFIFSNDQTYILEFGHLYMRVIQSSAQKLDPSKTISGVTNANPAVITVTGHGYTAADNGKEVRISDIVGAMATSLNGRNVQIVYIGANTLSLKTLDGVALNSTAFGSYTSGGIIEPIYSITTPYYETDLSELKFVQSADVITLVHHHYPPKELSRTGPGAWSLSDITFAPIQGPPTTVINNGAGGSTTLWKVTAVSETTLEESVASASTGTSATPSGGSPITVSWGSPTLGGAAYYNVYKNSNGIYGFIGVASNLSFKDTGIVPDTTVTPPTNRTPFTSTDAQLTLNSVSQANPGLVTMAAAHGYFPGDMIYMDDTSAMSELEGRYVLVRSVPSTTTWELNDIEGNALDTTSYTPSVGVGFCHRLNSFPSAVSYYQQRRLFANSREAPETVWATRTGLHKNLSVSTTTRDDDAVTFSMAGRQVNPVQHLLDLGILITLTDTGEHSIRGDAAGVLKPADINRRQESYYGAASNPAPIIVGGSALFVQARGSIIRDLGFTFESEGYRGNDLTVFSAHLFDGYTIVDWAYQQNPHSVAWVVRSDGVLLALTYVKEQQILGWSRHDTDGVVENVCCIPEGDEDAVYIVVKRTINGVAKRFIERMVSRQITDIADFVGMDACLSYDGRNESATTMALTEYSAGGWLYTSLITLTASVASFTSAEVGNEIHMTGADGETLRFEITEYVSTTVVRGHPKKTVPTSLRATAVTTWTRAVDEISGLWHLEGKAVSIFADGFVVASPNNDSYDVQTVSNGRLTLERCYGVIHIGLPFIIDMELLDLDTVQGETLANKQKLVSHVTLQVENTRGVFVGPEAPSDDDTDPLENLYEIRVRNPVEGYDGPVELATGKMDVHIKAQWDSSGRVFIRQVDPIPMSILAVSLTGLIPYKR